MAEGNESKITQENLPVQQSTVKDLKPPPKFGRPSLNPSNQETIWPLNQDVLTYKATERIIALSVPPSRKLQKNKHGRLFYMDSMGTPELLFKVSKSAKKFEATPRLQELSQLPKRYTLDSLHNRKPTSPEEPYYPITKGALEYKTSPRMYKLATPKKDFREPLPARKFVCFDHYYLNRLIEVPDRNPEREDTMMGTSLLESPQSINTEYREDYDAQLSQPKKLNVNYLPPIRLEDINKPIPRALTAEASTYTKELAKPKRRDKVYLHPKCYKGLLHSKGML